ncbi:hypothetical protein [Sphingomonas aracearum]|uniref:Uncharacterized protein n=1 Tax=Sphingomonas aracearum TaxID=2283317 RepID=A0A369VQV1_9SPHN|nr:hypothetical protein [Sphingomonas aracearum]RDE04768.1 hypothetical protein DVW87_14400 [Sphingomonas aracearum]
MKVILAAAVALAGTLAGTAPASAQALPKLVIYGAQKCPTDANGNEIVVCERRSPEEQFRIPKELRELEITPQNESWARRALSDDTPGVNGTGSCSAVGPGGSTGCFLREAQRNRRTNAARKAQQQNMEDSLNR